MLLQIHMKEDMVCQPVCHTKVYDLANKANEKSYRKLLYAIKKEYSHHWHVFDGLVVRCLTDCRMLDNMPAAECVENCRMADFVPEYRLGFPLGCAFGGDNDIKELSVCTVGAC